MNGERWRPLIEAALARSDDGLRFEDVRCEIEAGRAQPWYGVRSIAVTEMLDGPDGRTLSLWIGAGDLGELLALQPRLEAYARSWGCAWGEVCRGRRGWARVLRRRGFFEHGDGLRKKL